MNFIPLSYAWGQFIKRMKIYLLGGLIMAVLLLLFMGSRGCKAYQFYLVKKEEYDALSNDETFVLQEKALKSYVLQKREIQNRKPQMLTWRQLLLIGAYLSPDIALKDISVTDDRLVIKGSAIHEKDIEKTICILEQACKGMRFYENHKQDPGQKIMEFVVEGTRQTAPRE